MGMLIPKREKRRKQHRGRMTGRAIRGSKVVYGDYGLQATEPCWMTPNQLEAARVAINRYMKRGGKVWINVFPHMPLTRKPIGTRQGKGKGNVEGWVAVVKEGKILFEISGVTEEVAREALRLASHKLPIATKFVMKENGGENNEG